MSFEILDLEVTLDLNFYFWSFWGRGGGGVGIELPLLQVSLQHFTTGHKLSLVNPRSTWPWA